MCSFETDASGAMLFEASIALIAGWKISCMTWS